MNRLHVWVIVWALLTLVYFGVGSETLRDKYVQFNEGSRQYSSDIITNNQPSMYTYQLTPDTFTLFESELKITFVLLEQARTDFNESASTDRAAFELIDYVLVLAPVHPTQAGEDKMVAVFGIAKEKTESDPNWIDQVILRDGFALGLGVRDGGSDYFSVEINLTTGTSTGFATQGSA